NQINYYGTIYQISDAYSGEGNFSGTVLNALNSERVGGLNLDLRAGANITEGDIITSTATDTKGNYSFNDIPAGTYTVSVSGDGYTDTHFNVQVYGNTTRTAQNGLVTPSLELGETRIIMQWENRPEDLDLHLTGPEAGQIDRFHIFFGDRGSATASPNATLDKDDFGAYSSEIITIHNQQPGVYRLS